MDEKEAEARPVMGTIFLVTHCRGTLIVMYSIGIGGQAGRRQPEQ